MASGIRWVACIIPYLALTGCATDDLMVKRQTETEAKVELLFQINKKGEQRLNDMAGQIQTQDDQTKAATAELRQLQESVKELRNAQEELKARVILLAQQGATPKIEIVNPDTSSPKSRDTGPPPDYVKAFGIYSINNFPAAVEAFEAFLKSAPQSEYAANALYWIGECHYSMSSFPSALEYFQKVVDTYPKNPKAPDALLKLGITRAAMKEKDKAITLFEQLIKTYPSSPAAVKARERLTAN